VEFLEAAGLAGRKAGAENSSVPDYRLIFLPVIAKIPPKTRNFALL
jgi:hypothetical protein